MNTQQFCAEFLDMGDLPNSLIAARTILASTHAVLTEDESTKGVKQAIRETVEAEVLSGPAETLAKEVASTVWEAIDSDLSVSVHLVNLLSDLLDSVKVTRDYFVDRTTGGKLEVTSTDKVEAYALASTAKAVVENLFNILNMQGMVPESFPTKVNAQNQKMPDMPRLYKPGGNGDENKIVGRGANLKRAVYVLVDQATGESTTLSEGTRLDTLAIEYLSTADSRLTGKDVWAKVENSGQRKDQDWTIVVNGKQVSARFPAAK